MSGGLQQSGGDALNRPAVYKIALRERLFFSERWGWGEGLCKLMFDLAKSPDKKLSNAIPIDVSLEKIMKRQGGEEGGDLFRNITISILRQNEIEEFPSKRSDAIRVPVGQITQRNNQTIEKFLQQIRSTSPISHTHPEIA